MDIFEVLKLLVISIVEGITEWLPISSTGHMILVDEFLKLNFSADFKNLFLVVIQLGAILAVVVLYFEKLNPFSKRKTRYQREKTLDLWKKVIIGCLPAGVLGFLLDDFIEAKLLNPFVVATALIIYGILFIVIERYFARHKKQPKIKDFADMSYLDAAKIGGFQVLSLVPGTSRSGSTIIGGLLSGVSREIAAEFSFFMGIPIIFGAGALKIVKYGFNFSATELFTLGFSLVATFIVSIFAIKFLIRYLKNNDFQIFGWYRIIFGILVMIYFIFK